MSLTSSGDTGKTMAVYIVGIYPLKCHPPQRKKALLRDYSGILAWWLIIPNPLYNKALFPGALQGCPYNSHVFFFETTWQCKGEFQHTMSWW